MTLAALASSAWFPKWRLAAARRERPRHGILQAFVAGELRRLLPHGTTIAECEIETEIGVRVPDALWYRPNS